MGAWKTFFRVSKEWAPLRETSKTKAGLGADLQNIAQVPPNQIKEMADITLHTLPYDEYTREDWEADRIRCTVVPWHAAFLVAVVSCLAQTVITFLFVN